MIYKTNLHPLTINSFEYERAQKLSNYKAKSNTVTEITEKQNNNPFIRTKFNGLVEIEGRQRIINY